jgi:hypothetical protein
LVLVVLEAQNQQILRVQEALLALPVGVVEAQLLNMYPQLVSLRGLKQLQQVRVLTHSARGVQLHLTHLLLQ